MAKSIEQKAVEALAIGLGNYEFRNYEFCRLMAEQSPFVHREFFKLIASYLNYLSVFHKHGWYPNGVDTEAEISAEIVDTVNARLFP